MKKTYLILAIIGFILPNIFVVIESYNTGNYLLYTRPLETYRLMFTNNVSSAFIIDLLYIVLLFMAWSYSESKKLNLKYTWLAWLITFAFGIASGLPFYLYLKEKQRIRN